MREGLVGVGRVVPIRNISVVAFCCSIASLRARISSSSFISLLAWTDRRRRSASGALCRLGLRPGVLTALPPVLSRPFIARPDAKDEASYRSKASLEKGPMSALGQKQTYAVQNGMSALHSKATAKADIAVTPGITDWPCDSFPHSESRAYLLSDNSSNFEIFSERAHRPLAE